MVNLITSILENFHLLDIAQTIPSKPYIVDFIIGFISIPDSVVFVVILYLFYILELAIYWFLIGALFGLILEKRKSSDKKGLYTFLILFLGILIIAYIIIPVLVVIFQPTDIIGITDNSQIIRNLVIDGGACVIRDSETMAKTCIFTTKDDCDGSFNRGLLCTAEQLETNCGPTRNRLVIENKNYFIDSCGNQGNPYDEDQFTNRSYWIYSLQ